MALKPTDPSKPFPVSDHTYLSDANVTTTPLASEGVYTGGWEKTGAEGVTVSCKSVGVSGTLYFDFSDDGVNAEVVPASGYAISSDVYEHHSARLNGRYFRVRFVADAGTQTAFRLYTYYGPYNADGDSVSVSNMPTTAFGDLRVAELSPIYQVSFEYTVDNTEIGTKGEVNGGVVSQGDAMCVVTSNTTTGAQAYWETAHNVKYHAGMGGLMRGTAMFTEGVANTTQALYMGDEPGTSTVRKNGYGVGYVGTEFGFLRWQNDSQIFVAATDWDDPLDGTGASGITIDPTKLNVYFIQFQYLGAGAIKIWVENSSTGAMHLAHTIPYANLNTVPSIYNPNFHIGIGVINGTTTENIVAKSASMAYFVEGKTKHIEVQQPHQVSGRITKNTVTTETALFTIRNKSTYASVSNFIDLTLEGISIGTESSGANNLAGVRVVKNATLGGTPSWSDINTTDSVCEIDTSGTTVTGGKQLFDFEMAGKNDRVGANLTDYDVTISPGDSVTVSVESANSATFKGALLWKELF